MQNKIKGKGTVSGASIRPNVEKKTVRQDANLLRTAVRAEVQM